MLHPLSGQFMNSFGGGLDFRQKLAQREKKSWLNSTINPENKSWSKEFSGFIFTMTKALWSAVTIFFVLSVVIGERHAKWLQCHDQSLGSARHRDQRC